MTKEETTVNRLIRLFPLYSQDLGIDLSSTLGRFKWFIASILFGARIGEQIAANTFFRLNKAGIIDSPQKIISTGWDRLVELLDEGGYVRYDFSTATKLLEIMKTLQQGYEDLENFYQQSLVGKNLERSLLKFKGIGPTTVQIFLRELRGIWEVELKICNMAKTASGYLNINLETFKGHKLARIETALVKLYLRYCKKRRCNQCPMDLSCNEIN